MRLSAETPAPAEAPPRPGFILAGLLIIVALGVAASGDGSLTSFLDLPSFIIVVGGTMAALLVSTPWSDLHQAAAACRELFAHRGEDLLDLARTLVDLARAARRGGVLALQARAADPALPLYLRRGLNLAADGTPEEEVDTLLRLEAHATADRARHPAAVLRRAADYAPAMGLIGTLIGLVEMLGRLDDPSSIGPSLAVALLTTFYGAVLANLVFNPLAAKLERRAGEEAIAATMIRFAILLIVRRENPSRIEIMLNSVLPPHRQLGLRKDEGAKGA